MRASSWFLVALVCGGLALSALAGASFAQDQSRAGGFSMRGASVRANATILGVLAGAGEDVLVLEISRERPEGDFMRVGASWSRPATAVLVPPGYHPTVAAVEALRNGTPVEGALAVAEGATSLEADVPIHGATYPPGDHATWAALGLLARDVAQERDASRPAPTLEERRAALDLGLRATQSAVLVLRFAEPVPEAGEPLELRVQPYRSDGAQAARWLAFLAAPFAAGALAAGVASARARRREADGRDASATGDRVGDARLLEGALRHASSMETFLMQAAWASRLLGMGLVLLALVALQALALLSAPMAASRVPLAAAGGILTFVALGAACLAVGWMLHVRRVRRETAAWRRRFKRVRLDQEHFLDEA